MMRPMLRRHLVPHLLILASLMVSGPIAAGAPAQAKPPAAEASPQASPDAAAEEKALTALLAGFSSWTVHTQASGDLNGDGLSDVALVLRRESSEATEPGSKGGSGGEAEEQVEALLVLALRDPSGAYRVHTRAPKAICVGCGGVKAPFGEPLGELSIERGVLTILVEGGSRAIWSNWFRWRLDPKANRFLLIGHTSKTTDTVGEEPDALLDINFSTGKAERREGGKTKRCRVREASRRLALDTFDYQEYQPALEKCR